MPDGNRDGGRYEGSADQFPLPLPPIPPTSVANPRPSPHSLAPPDDFEYHEGGGFTYEECPNIFLGRTGYGPLRAAWDTNILIDYATYGNLIWKQDEFDPPVIEPAYREQLLALGTFVHLWMMRDIRVKVPFRQVYDSRRRLSATEWSLREYRIRQFQAALDCVNLDLDIQNEVTPFAVLPDDSTNDEWDDSLLLEAIENGCHVFLTRDNKLVRRLRDTALTALMLVMRPKDLIQALDDANELGFGGEGYMFPDNHKWLHFMLASEHPDV